MSEHYTGFSFMYETQVVIVVRRPVQTSTTCFITHCVFTESDIVFPSLGNLKLLKLA